MMVHAGIILTQKVIRVIDMDYSKGGYCPFPECFIDEKEAEIAHLKARVVLLEKVVQLAGEYHAYPGSLSVSRELGKALANLWVAEVKP